MSRCGCRQKEDDSWGTEKIFALNENIHWESWISDMKRERPETENKNVKNKGGGQVVGQPPFLKL